jgi:predicted PurR-regulated permease PerM
VEIERNLYVLGDAVYIPDGQVDTPYSFQLSAFGGVPPYSWEFVTGELPSGLNLAQDGQITGNPIVDSLTDIEVNASDSQGGSVKQKIHLTVNPAPTPIWKKIFVYIEVVLRIIAYVFLAFILYFFLFVDREEATVYQPAYKSPWSRFRERFKR